MSSNERRIHGIISKEEIKEKGIQETEAAHIFAYDTTNREVVGVYEFPSDEAASRREFHMEIGGSVNLNRVQFVWVCKNNTFLAQIHPTVQ